MSDLPSLTRQIEDLQRDVGDLKRGAQCWQGAINLAMPALLPDSPKD